jgi:hypothetical protein
MSRRLNADFLKLSRDFLALLDKLRNNVCPKGKSKGIPKQGVYAFYERGHPLYVGRSNTLRTRARQHTGWSGSRYNATFAFKVAKRKYRKAGNRVDGVTRARLEQRGKFKPFFSDAKFRVSRMDLHAVSIPNQRKQAFFELYAQVVLKTKRYNSFGTY